MTILGQHTGGELRDLLRAYDYQLAQLQEAAAAAAPAWSRSDPGEHDRWTADFAAWQASYHPVRQTAADSIAGWFEVDATDTRETEYQALAAAFAPLADFDRRMRAAPAAASSAPTYPNNPQPSAPDADRGAYVAVDAGIAAMPAPVRGVMDRLAATAGVGRGVVGADNRTIVPSPTNPWVIAGGLLAAVVLVGVLRR